MYLYISRQCSQQQGCVTVLSNNHRNSKLRKIMLNFTQRNSHNLQNSGIWLRINVNDSVKNRWNILYWPNSVQWCQCASLHKLNSTIIVWITIPTPNSHSSIIKCNHTDIYALTSLHRVGWIRYRMSLLTYEMLTMKKCPKKRWRCGINNTVAIALQCKSTK